MNKSYFAVWALMPLAAWAYHEGPGQDRMRLDDVDGLVREAYAEACDERWGEAVESYSEALAALPADQTELAHRIRLERAKAMLQDSGLPQAREQLGDLVDELQSDEPVDETLLADARGVLANSQYYMTWLMRLEGMPREEWEPEIEASRQTYRLLAEQAQAQGDQSALEKNREDLEASIRLARMDLTELQGLPLPSQ